MSDPSKTCEPMSLFTGASTSSQESACGTTPCALPDGPQSGPSGPPRARANRSRRQGSARGPRMTATFGRTFFDSSESDSLTASLVSRYRALTDSLGSTMYEVTWKRRVTPAGHWIPAQRASARPTLVSVSIGADCELSGWPTPTTRDWKSGDASQDTLDRNARPLSEVAVLSGWPTPNTPSGGPNTKATEKHTGRIDLDGAVTLAGWATPRAEDAESAGMRHSRGVADTLTAQAVLAGWATPNVPNGGRISGNPEDIGKKRDGSKAQIGLENQARLAATGPGPIGFSLGPNGWAISPACGQLNPAHSRWLMALPPAWDACGVTAMQSLRPRRRRSSGA
jgi:hypothetical protein